MFLLLVILNNDVMHRIRRIEKRIHHVKGGKLFVPKKLV